MMAGVRPTLFKDGTQKRDWVFVEDILQGILLSIDKNVSDIFNLGSGEATSFNDLVAIINKNLGTDFQPEYIDNPAKDAFQGFTLADISKAGRMLGYNPVYNVEKGIAKYIEELKK
jgi:ADP-L-glycero-D-manno-heptose 6-epimerase